MADLASALPKKAACFTIALSVVLFGASLRAEPATSKTSKSTTALDRRLIESANGWTYSNGQWAHPDGYKFINNKIIRTTAKPGKAPPKPPGTLAQENAAKLAPRTKPAAVSATEKARADAEKAAELRRKNLEPRPAPRMGSHL